jgi:hypothetical protein
LHGVHGPEWTMLACAKTLGGAIVKNATDALAWAKPLQ